MNINWSDIFNYDPVSGVLTNKNTRGSRAVEGDVAGGVNVHGYISLCYNHKKYLAHRIIWDMNNGHDLLSSSDEIDHINGVKTDNRLNNLRKVCRADNQRNVARRKDNKTGVTGVFIDQRCPGKWLAKIKAEGRSLYLGSFETLEEAVITRKAAEEKFNYHKNHGRKN